MKRNQMKVCLLLSLLILSACSPLKESSESVSITASSVEQDETMITKEQFVSLSHKIYDKGYTRVRLDMNGIAINESKYDFIREAEFNHRFDNGYQVICYHVTGNKYDYEFDNDGDGWSYIRTEHDSKYDRITHAEEWYNQINGVAFEKLVYNTETKAYDYADDEYRYSFRFKDQVLISIEAYHHEMVENEWTWKYGVWNYFDIGDTFVYCPLSIKME